MHLRHLVERGPTDGAALDRLGKLAEALGDPAQQAQILELGLRQRRRKDRPALLARLARIYEQDLKQPSQALRTWARLLPASPEDPRALEALLRLADQHQARSGALAGLRGRADGVARSGRSDPVGAPPGAAVSGPAGLAPGARRLGVGEAPRPGQRRRCSSGGDRRY